MGSFISRQVMLLSNHLLRFRRVCLRIRFLTKTLELHMELNEKSLRLFFLNVYLVPVPPVDPWNKVFIDCVYVCSRCVREVYVRCLLCVR